MGELHQIFGIGSFAAMVWKEYNSHVKWGVEDEGQCSWRAGPDVPARAFDPDSSTRTGSRVPVRTRPSPADPAAVVVTPFGAREMTEHLVAKGLTNCTAKPARRSKSSRLFCLITFAGFIVNGELVERIVDNATSLSRTVSRTVFAFFIVFLSVSWPQIRGNTVRLQQVSLV